MLAGLLVTAALAFADRTAQDVPSSQADPSRERSAWQKREGLFIGTQFFRPPNPRPEDLDRDLARVKRTGLRVVRVWMFWSAVNPRPDVWEWSQYDRVFELAEKHGLKVLLQHIPEAPPRWAMQKFPAEPNACIDNSGAAGAREEFMRRAAERYRSRASLYGHDVWNEVSGGGGWCKPEAGRFQAWLFNKYKDIGALNRRYGATYTDFSEVPDLTQRSGEYAEQFDNADFHQALLAEAMRRRVRAVRMADPDHPVVSHWTGFSLMVWDADAWGFAPFLDRWGTSSYIGHRGLTPSAVHELALQFNMTRDSARGKPWWLAEHPSGTVWSGLGHTLISNVESRFRTILAFAFGAEAALYWQWRPEIHGGEASHFGLTGFDGELTPRTDDVRQLCRMLEREKLVFDQLEWPRPRVGLLWDTRGLLLEQASSADSPDENAVGTRNFEGFYSVLLDQGYDVEVLNAHLLAESGVPEGVRVVFAPFQPFDREGLSANLREWVKNGGTLFAGPLYGLFAPDTYLNKKVPPPSIAEVFGVRHQQTYYAPQPEVRVAANRAAFRSLPAAFNGRFLIESFQINGAEVLGTWQGKPAFTALRFGRGRGIMCGTFVAAGYRSEESTALRQLVDSVCAAAGVAPEAHASAGCLVRTARAGSALVVFLFNPSDKPKQTELTLRQPRSGVVRDLLAEKEVLGTLAGKAWRLTLEPKEAKILLLN